MVILFGVCVWHALIGSVIYRNLPKKNDTKTIITAPSPNKTNIAEVNQIILSLTNFIKTTG